MRRLPLRLRTHQSRYRIAAATLRLFSNAPSTPYLGGFELPTAMFESSLESRCGRMALCISSNLSPLPCGFPVMTSALRRFRPSEANAGLRTCRPASRRIRPSQGVVRRQLSRRAFPAPAEARLSASEPNMWGRSRPLRIDRRASLAPILRGALRKPQGEQQLVPPALSNGICRAAV